MYDPLAASSKSSPSSPKRPKSPGTGGIVIGRAASPSRRDADEGPAQDASGSTPPAEGGTRAGGGLKGLARFKAASSRVVDEERQKRPMEHFGDVVVEAMGRENFQRMLEESDKQLDVAIDCASETFVDVGDKLRHRHIFFSRFWAAFVDVGDKDKRQCCSFWCSR